MAGMAQPVDDMLRSAEVEVQVDGGLARVAGRAVRLSPHEFRLLVALMEQERRVVRREDLYQRAWGTPLRPGDRSVDVYVHRLRSKLESVVPGRAFIHTHRGFGYRFEPLWL